MIFALDTSFLIGLFDTRDVWHCAAVRLQEGLTVARLAPIYFDCVLAEAVSAVARRMREQQRADELPPLMDRLDEELPVERLTWLLPDVPRLYREVLRLIRTSNGELNFNDGLIALACREREIRLLASFDRDFDRIDWLTRVATPDDVTAAMLSFPELRSDADIYDPC